LNCVSEIQDGSLSRNESNEDDLLDSNYDSNYEQQRDDVLESTTHSNENYDTNYEQQRDDVLESTTNEHKDDCAAGDNAVYDKNYSGSLYKFVQDNFRFFFL